MLSIFGQLSYAQPSHIDSLKKALSNTKIVSGKVNILIELSFSYLFNHPDSSIYFSQEAKKLALKIGNMSQYSLAIYREGIAFRGKGDLARAFELLSQSLKIAEKQSDNFLTAINIKGIGLIYFDLSYYDKAIEYFQKALEIFRKLEDYEQITIVCSNLGKLYIYLQDYHQSEKYLSEAKSLSAKHAPYFQSFILLAFGEIYLDKKKDKETILYLNQALKIAEKFDDKQDLSSTNRLFAKYYFKNQKLDSAILLAKKSLEIVKYTQMKENIYLSYQLLSDIYEAKLDFEQSLKYDKLSNIYKDSILSINTKNSLIIFDTERKKEEIKALKANNEYQVLLNYIFTIAILLILCFAFFWYWNHRKIRSTYQRLHLAYLEIQARQEKVINQNEELKQFQDKITHLNNHLERLVEERTLKIQQKNKQLTDYAFFNAHKLRAPIATIMGLYEILHLLPTEEEQKFIFAQIIFQIKNLDEMVKKSQQILNLDEDTDE